MLDIDLKIFHLLSKINPVAITLDDCNYSLFKLGYDFWCHIVNVWQNKDLNSVFKNPFSSVPD